MENDDPPGRRPDHTSEVRRRVLAAAVEVMSDHPADPPGGVYFTVLLDRLPMLAAALYGLRARTGTRTVTANLVEAAVAAMDFYGDALAACSAAFHRPGDVISLRRALLGNDIGPHRAHQPVADYLAAERERGRVDTAIDPLPTARLLLGGCLNHALVGLIMGEGVLPPRQADAEYLVAGLRLEPA